MAYTLETVLSEKFETIIRRNIGTTRARDFYDLHILLKTKYPDINIPNLKLALSNTTEKRWSKDIINEIPKIIHDIQQDKGLERLWNTYVKANSYAMGITFKDVVDSVKELASLLEY